MNRDAITRFLADSLGGGLTCKEFVEMVTDYLEGALSFPDWVRLQLHLRFCYGCRVYLRQMKRTIRAVGRLPATPVPPPARAQLLRQWRGRTS
jgi:hypothetical protein